MEEKQVLELNSTELLTSLGSSLDGLHEGQVIAIGKRYPPNTLESHKTSAARVLWRQFNSSLIYLLLASSALSYLLKDFLDGTAIALIIALNAILGFLQEFKSEKAIEKLSQLISKEVMVKRDGKNQLIDEKGLVPGDIVILKEGDIIPADCRVIEAEHFQVNESQLTGESVPVAKDEQHAFLLFAGSTVEKGIATALVYSTGNNTRLGSIAHLSATTKKVTPYEQSLRSFSNFLIKISLFTLAFIFGAKLLLVHDFRNLTPLFLFVVALAIAVVPEVLPVIVTITLSNGALKLAKKHVIVKKISALEDLGNINLLCTDKTGTLTENKLTVTELISEDKELFQHFAIASIEEFDEKHRHNQDSFDLAFLNYVPEEIQQQSRKQLELIAQLPFDPAERRRKVVIFDKHTQQHFLVILGSAETLLELSHYNDKELSLKKIHEDSQQGLRHHAIAYRKVDNWNEEFSFEGSEHDLHFIGYVTLADPLRPTAKHTVELAKKLGITIKILSGDSKEVSGYIAQQIGLIETGGLVYTGEELEKMSRAVYREAVQDCHVFARISPEQKYEIIKTLKEHNTVGYQGDGINDAPALKLADVAIAVNTATDVAKESADILLLHQDLGVIISGIQYGRAIFHNINKYIRHTMVGNFGQLFALAGLYLLSPVLPLLTIQLLVANILVDVPMVTISSDSVDAHDLKQPEHYDIKSLMSISLILGSITTLFVITFYAFAFLWPHNQAITSFFLFIILSSLINIFSVRNKDAFWQGVPASKLLIISNIFIAALAISLMYIPSLQKLFSLTPLSLTLLVFLALYVVLYLVALDMVKIWYYNFFDRIPTQKV